MTLSLDTYQPVVRKSFLPDVETSLCYFYLISQQNIESVILNFSGNTELVTGFSEDELTLLTMESSEKSFAELWDLEDDDYWNSYLHD
jgi:hypothetical protein